MQDAQAGIIDRYNMAHDRIEAQASLTDYAMFRAAAMKRNQNTLEAMVPDATELLSLIVNAGAMNIARLVAGFEG